MERVLKFHPGLLGVARDPRMQGACGQLFGEPALLFKDKVNFKLPGGGGFEAHQDAQAGWERYGSLHITALITVDRTTRANGCLEMAAGCHRRGLIGDEWAPLGGGDLDGVEFVPIEAEPGDTVFFDSYAPHRSAPNKTDRARRVLYITYGKASDGDQMEQYYADKFASYPPDIEREAGKDYRYKV
jgi:ectoine hydroxylase-related dioxygenase (phytanoyl-CoA dioxygenase family)